VGTFGRVFESVFALGSLKASVVVPTFNAGARFGELLERLRTQEASFAYEVLVIDSGSTDGTVELTRRYGASIYRVSRNEFGHGATRNLGVSLARGEYVAFIVQDAVPLDERWLAPMVEDLEQDEMVAGVYGRQLPRPESSPLTRVLVNSWPTADLRRREQFVRPPTLYGTLPPVERRSLAMFDNVSSCVRRSVWEAIPFEATRFAEDLRWSKKVVEAGYKIVYEPRSAVFHSHERGAFYDLRRYYVDQLALFDLFGLVSTPNLALLLQNILRASAYFYLRLLRDEKSVVRTARLVPRALKYAVFSQTGAYLAVKNRRLARVSPQISDRLDRFLSRGI
jgi:rhamnosyltransferase